MTITNKYNTLLKYVCKRMFKSLGRYSNNNNIILCNQLHAINKQNNILFSLAKE